MSKAPRGSVEKAEAAARRVLESNREVIGADQTEKICQRYYVLSTSLDNELSRGSTISRAKKGDGLAIKACLEAAAKFIGAQQSLPLPLAEFVADFLINAANRVAGQKTRPRLNHMRDLTISTAVYAAAKDGALRTTRNLATRDKGGPESGSSVVARILPEFGLDIKEDAVDKIWKRYKE